MRSGSFAAEKFPEGLENATGNRRGLLPEVLHFLRELGLGSAVNLTGDGRDFVVRQGNFVGSPGGVASRRGEMIRDGTNSGARDWHGRLEGVSRVTLRRFRHD